MTKPRSIAILAWAVLAALAPLARADEGPIIIANKEVHPYLTLDPIHGSLGVTGYYQTQNNSSGGQSANATDSLLTQDLSLSTGGTIISRNLASWTVGGTLSLQEEWTTGGGPSQSQTGVFETYDLEFNALNTTAYPMSAFAQRSESLLNRPFAPLLRDTTTGYGATFHYNDRPLPSTLSISHTTTTESSLDGTGLFTINQDELDYGTSFQPTERQNISLNYHYATISQDNPGTLNNDSQLQGVSASHNWSIDSAARYTLTQTLDYSNQTGNYPFTQLRVGEQFRMRHTPTLESALNYAYEEHDYATTATTRQSASYNVIHRLFESLTTTARVGGSVTQNTFSNTDQSGGTATSTDLFSDIAFSYQKKAYMGRLGANLSLGYDQTDNSSVGAPQQVLGDTQTFADPLPIILTRPGIDPSTIAVFNASGSRRLVRGVDYTVQTVGNTVQIQRLVGAAINPGDSILLNYIVDPLPGYASTSTSIGAGINYLVDEGPLRGLNPYARYSQVDQTISPQTAGVHPDSVRDTVVGVEYRIWKLTLRAEDEDRQSTLSPYTAQRLTARYDDRMGDRTTLSFGAAQTYMQYPSDNSKTSLTTFDGRVQYQITRGLTTTLTTLWRNEEDSGTGATRGLEEQLELRWKIRQTDIFGLIRQTSLDTQDNSSGTLFFQFGVSRNF